MRCQPNEEPSRQRDCRCKAPEAETAGTGGQRGWETNGAWEEAGGGGNRGRHQKELAVKRGARAGKKHPNY